MFLSHFSIQRWRPITVSPNATRPNRDIVPPGRTNVNSPIVHSSLPSSFSNDIRNLVLSNNEFGFKLYASLNHLGEEHNIFISPVSLFSTLITVYAGSSTKTEEEMIYLLKLKNMSESQVQRAFRDIMHVLLYDIGKENNLKMLNAILLDKSLNISKKFTEKIRTYYNAYLEKVGFSSEPEYVVDWTNHLVNWWTEGQIPTLLSNQPDPLTKVLLINAIYFKGRWLQVFNLEDTADDTFKNRDGKTVQVPFMKLVSNFNYHCNQRFCAIELPYSGGLLSFIIIVPASDVTLEDIEQNFNQEMADKIVESFRVKTVELIMPKFSIRANYDLIKVLQDMGMKAAFSPENADLSRMGDNKELFVKQAKHKTAIQVNEEGTVAAAATIAEIGSRKQFKRFHVNKPFIFMIRDVKTNIIVFLGRVNYL